MDGGCVCLDDGSEGVRHTVYGAGDYFMVRGSRVELL